jgi:hypothetical protein
VSSSASPRHNSIWQPSIPHDRLRQSGRPTCSKHAFTEVCLYLPATLQNLLHQGPETTRYRSAASPAYQFSSLSATMFDHKILYPAQQTAFNIHKSKPDHRVRGKRLRLPSHPLIETAPHVQTAKPWPSCAGRFRCRLTVTARNSLIFGNPNFPRSRPPRRTRPRAPGGNGPESALHLMKNHKHC